MRCGAFLILLIPIFVVQVRSSASTQGCGGSLYQDSGTVASPNYPSSVPSNQRCAWTIRVAESKIVFLNFKRVELSVGQPGVCTDSVQVYDGDSEQSKRLVQWCGFKNQTELSGSVFKSSGNTMYITFTSDNSTGGRGFIATFQGQDCDFKYGRNLCNNSCSCVRENTLSCDNIQGTCVCKPGWISADCSQTQCKDLNCDYICQVTSTDPWTEECQCPPYMKLPTNNSSACIERYPCGSTIRDQSGSITSPGFPNPYGNSLLCSWTIYGGTNTVITISFDEIDLEAHNTCGYDSVSMYDGSSSSYRLMGQYCTQTPKFLRSTGNTMHIVFKTDGSGQRKGFHARFYSKECPDFTYGENCTDCICNRETTVSCNQISGACTCQPGWGGSRCTCDQHKCYPNWQPAKGCSQTLTDSSGRFTSPWYPNHYSGKTACNWTIEAPPNHIITLRFPNFRMVNSNCSYGSVRVYDGGPSGQLIREFCGTGMLYMTRSSGSTMFVDFEASHSQSGVSGFSAMYETHDCPELTYGDTCNSSCQCMQENTKFCDMFTGVCVCKSGWMGSDCSLDIDECQYPDFYECSSNSFCVNEPGNFFCNCSEGYFKNQTTGLCEVDAFCTWKQCSHSCIKIGTQETCLCPDDYLQLDSTGLKCVVPYYPYGEPASDSEVSATKSNKINNRLRSDTIKFGMGVPVGGYIETEAFVYFDGLISFGNDEPPYAPNWIEAERKHLNLLAPFWTQTHMSVGKLFYHLYEKCDTQMFDITSQSTPAPMKEAVMERARRDVIRIYSLEDFDVNTVLVATWYSIQPPMASTNNSRRIPGNTFQTVYVSGYPKRRDRNGVVTVESERAYALYIYQHGQMNWPQATEQRSVNTGYVINGKITDLGANGMNLDDTAWTADYKGIMSLPIGHVNMPLENCHNYVCKHAYLMTSAPYQTEIQGLYKCPCTLDRLGPQWEQLEKRGQDIYCYAIRLLAKRRLLQNNPRNKVCCYQGSKLASSSWPSDTVSQRQASYLSAPAKDAGHILIADPSDNVSKETLWAHQQCCGGGDQSQCDKFHRLFPDMGCSNMVTFVSARALGDPHIITLDWMNYTMNGLGEYTLMDMPDENFVLQARTGIAFTADGEETKATVFTAFAAQEADIHFQVELTSSRTSMVIYAEKEDVTSDFYADTDFSYSTENISVVRKVVSNKTCVMAVFPCGVAIKVVVGVRSLDITLEVDKSLQNRTRGLLGNFNDDPDDDFLLPNGTILSSTMSESEIFHFFAKQYELTSATSVFLYFAGESTDDYLHPEFLPVFKDEIDEAKLAAAEEMCQGSSSCIYDYAVTEDETFAMNSRDSQSEIENINLNAENTPPTISTISGDNFDDHIWMVTVGTPSTLHIVAADDDGDTITFDVENPPSEMTVSSRGLLIYTPSLRPIRSLNIRVRDSKGAYSEYRNIAVKTCTGCSGNGTCDLTKTRTIRTGEAEFQFMRCNCLPSYSGDECDLDRDGCASKPCSPGQECTDIPAKEQGDSDIGFECGPCPLGFLRTNITCDLDIDECSNSTICQQICTNTYGSYICSCGEGYRLDSQDMRTCLDIDECEELTSGCDLGCSNSDGNFTCSCPPGYTLNEDGKTCSLAVYLAAACRHCDQVCIINNNVAVCDCKQGYQVDPNDETKCVDVNECDPTRYSPCTQVCVNTYGSFECDCYAGYRLDSDDISCTECTGLNYGFNCSSTCRCFGRGSCDPVRGCVCNDGWSGVSCHKDVDECLQSNVCPDGQVCQNEQGSFSCVCATGYQMENRECVDVNECTDLGVIPYCNASLEICVNTDGSYRCECKPGYTHGGDVDKCIDINECQQEGHGCDQICENKPGTYKCKCEADFKLADDRRTCHKP